MRERAILLIGGTIVAGIFVLIFAVRPVHESNKEQKALLQDQEAELATVQAELASTKRLIADYQAVAEDEKASLNKRFPSDPQTEALIVQLETMAIGSQVIVSSINLSESEEQNAQGVRNIFVDLSLSGEYPNLVNFLKEMQANDRLMTILDLSMVPGDLGLNANVTAEAYFAGIEVKQKATPATDATQSTSEEI